MNKIDELKKALEDARDILKTNDKKPPDYGVDEETKNFLEHWEPKTKHPKEPTAGMPAPNKPGERTTSTGFKLKAVKKGDECLKFNKSGQWSIEKSNEIKPFGQNIYDSVANINRKATRTGEERPGVGRNQAVRQYTTSNSSIQQANEKAQEKVQRAKTKASTRTFADMTEEEKAALRAQYEGKKNG